MSEKPEALRLAQELEALNGAKRDYGGTGGQMLGCEQYRLVASGSSFAALPNSADALLRLHADNERLKAENAEWQAKAATWLASPEAAKRLEGYRELGEQLAQAEAEIERLKAENDALRRDAECYKRLKSRAEIYDGHVCFGDIRLPAPIPDRSPFDIIDEAVLAASADTSTAPASAAVDALKQPATEPAIRARGEVPR